MHDPKELAFRLEAELATVTTELEAIARYNHETTDWVAIPDTEETPEADPTNEADSVEEWNARRALMPQLETRWRNLRLALSKFDNGTYGICEISGEPIETERLEANPAARTCLKHLNDEDQLPL
jgi:DnaK suppressor protein